jgi:hypothetical protein
VFSVARQSHVTDVVLVELRARTLSTPGGVSRIGLFIGRFLGAAVGHSWGVQGAYAIGVSGPVGAAILLLAAGDRAGVDGPPIPERQSIRQCSWDSGHTFLTLRRRPRYRGGEGFADQPGPALG